MLAGRDDRFANNVKQIGSDDKIHGNTRDEQGGAGQKTSANTEKTAEDSNDKTEPNEIGRVDGDVGNGKIHLFPFPANESNEQRANDFQAHALADHQ